ncbi:MAG: 6-bladed beta-propeller [Phycisphaerae bacterium]|nr:6-bladed beta-propeller [Phycisphaerae bacterium]
MRNSKYISVLTLFYLSNVVSMAFGHIGTHADLLQDGMTATSLIRMGTGDYGYESVPHWCQLPKDVTQLGNTHGNIIVDAAGSVYFNTDTARSVMVYRADGSFVRAFGQQTVGIHDMVLHQEGDTSFIYAAHLGGHQVVKYTLDGQLVWTLPWPDASGKYQNAGQYKPTAVTVAPDGSFYVADGYGENWIHHFRADRSYVRSFGGKGQAPGRFDTCHGLRVDTRTSPPTLIVCDRENRRLQRFSLDGNFLEVLATGLRRPCHIDFLGDLTVVAELEARVTILDKDFRVLAHLGDNPDHTQWASHPVGPDQWQEGVFMAPHGVAFDGSGNLYVMDWNRSGRISKLVRQP